MAKFFVNHARPPQLFQFIASKTPFHNLVWDVATGSGQAVKSAKQYAEARPNYPPLLFHFIASKTSYHSFAWDVATGGAQAAKSLAALYKNVIATDVSEKQLESAATKLPNVQYQHTPSTMSMSNLEQKVELQGTVDLVTIAQALHWFNLPTFYEQVKWILKKPQGVIVAWCYNLPRVGDILLISYILLMQVLIGTHQLDWLMELIIQVHLSL